MRALAPEETVVTTIVHYEIALALIIVLRQLRTCSSVMISALLSAMKPITLALTFLVLSGFPPAMWSAGPDDANQPATVIGPSVAFSADDFDWHETLASLYVAAGLPDEQGIKAALENSRVLRAYVASDIQAECQSGSRACAEKTGSSSLQGEVTKRIDEIVQEGTSHHHKVTLVDYALMRQPFPFTDIAAMRTENHHDAYLVLDFASNTYNVAQLRDKYGAPYDTDVREWYGVYKYRLDTRDYAARVAFEIDPVDGSVLRMAIRLKRKDGRK
jgi:hypothetical protein